MAVTNPTRAFHRVTNWEVATGLCVRSLLPDEERVCKACGKQRGFLHDEHCNPAGPNATIRHNHVNFAHSGLGDASRSPGLQRIHNRCFFQAQRYPVGEPKLLSPHGRCRLRGSGDRLRCYCRVSAFGKAPPDIRKLVPTQFRLAAGRARKKTAMHRHGSKTSRQGGSAASPRRHSGDLPPTRLHYRRVNRRRDMGHHKRVEGECLSGRLRLDDGGGCRWHC